MGAGISRKNWRERLYRHLKVLEAKLANAGVQAKYDNLEVKGDGFSVFYRSFGPASNGERAALLEVTGPKSVEIKKILNVR